MTDNPLSGKRILWVEDDYYAINGLFRPLMLLGADVDVADCAMDGFKKLQRGAKYDLIVVDLILPLAMEDGKLPDKVSEWMHLEYVGIGLARWMLDECKVTCPVVVLSVVRHPNSRYDLKDLGIAKFLYKPYLTPLALRDELLPLLQPTTPPPGEASSVSTAGMA